MATANDRASLPAYEEKLAWLEAQEVAQPDEQRSRRLAVKAWNALWPKLLAIAIVLGRVGADPRERLEEARSSPPPGPTLANLWDQLQTAELWHAIATTLRARRHRVRARSGDRRGHRRPGFADPPLRAAVGSLITGLQTMPSIAWFPFAIILFGISTTTIMFVIILGAAPSIANGLIAGVDYTPPLLLRAGKIMGLRRIALYRHLILPASLPAFVAGLKQGWAFAWRSLIAGELLVTIANQPSIGVLLSTYQSQADMESATAIIIVILILGIIVDMLFGLADRTIRRRWGLTGAV